MNPRVCTIPGCPRPVVVMVVMVRDEPWCLPDGRAVAGGRL